MNWFHGMAGDKALLFYLIIGTAMRAAPFILTGAVALAWWLQ